LFEEKLGENTI